MIESMLDVGGAVVFWTAAEFTDRDKLRAGLQPLGLDEFVPEPRDDLSCRRPNVPHDPPLPDVRRRITAGRVPQRKSVALLPNSASSAVRPPLPVRMPRSRCWRWMPTGTSPKVTRARWH